MPDGVHKSSSGLQFASKSAALSREYFSPKGSSTAFFALYLVPASGHGIRRVPIEVIEEGKLPEFGFVGHIAEG